MIELIYLENGLYVKKLLVKAYNSHLDEMDVWVTTFSFKGFVERVFTDVINWYSWDMQENNNALGLLNFDENLAEDLLDSISGLTMSELENWSVKFKVEYLEGVNAILVRSAPTDLEVVLPDPLTYAQSYEKVRNNQLSKFARLLNELRTSGTGKLG